MGGGDVGVTMHTAATERGPPLPTKGSQRADMPGTPWGNDVASDVIRFKEAGAIDKVSRAIKTQRTAMEGD